MKLKIGLLLVNIYVIVDAYSTVQYSTVQYSTEQYSTVQYSTVQYSSKEFLTAFDFRKSY